jgi:hypothetical protein
MGLGLGDTSYQGGAMELRMVSPEPRRSTRSETYVVQFREPYASLGHANPLGGHNQLRHITAASLPAVMGLGDQKV